PLVKDEKLRSRLVGALQAAGRVREQVEKQIGTAGAARRLASDQILRAQLRETVRELQAAQKRARKVRSHRIRNVSLFLTAIGFGALAAPSLRRAILSLLKGESSGSERSRSDETASGLAEI